MHMYLWNTWIFWHLTYKNFLFTHWSVWNSPFPPSPPRFFALHRSALSHLSFVSSNLIFSASSSLLHPSIPVSNKCDRENKKLGNLSTGPLYLLIYCLFPRQEMHVSWGQRTPVFCSPLHCQCLEYCLAYSWCSKNIHQVDEWMKVVHCNVTYQLYSSLANSLILCDTRHVILLQKGVAEREVFLSISPSFFYLAKNVAFPSPRICRYQAKRLYRGLIWNSLPFGRLK